ARGIVGEAAMKIRVLMVDDELEFIETLAERLESRGLAVATAGSGDEAIEKVAREDYDVVVLDILMPVKDGVATLKEIKQIRPLIEVIMLSGNATVESAVD
ncbi:MAG: response regulator, partial [Acidobacteriota bacterium]